MNKFLKKALAMLLAVMMCVGMVTTTAFAKETVTQPVGSTSPVHDEGKACDYLKDGTHKDHHSWSKDQPHSVYYELVVPQTCDQAGTYHKHCANNSKCSVNEEYVYPAAKEHVYVYTYAGNGKHNVTCSQGTDDYGFTYKCGYELLDQPCTFVNGVCTDCGYGCASAGHVKADGTSAKSFYAKKDDITHTWTCTICRMNGEDNHSTFSPNPQQIAELADLCEHQTKIFQYQCADCGTMLTSPAQQGTKSFTKVYAQPTDPNSDHTSHTWTCSNGCTAEQGGTGTELCDPLVWTNDDGTTGTGDKCAMGDIPQTAVCAVCGAEVHRTVKGDGTHNLQEHGASEATCTEDGHAAYWQCTICHTKFKDADANEAWGTTTVNGVEVGNEVIPATGHSMTKTDAKAATCTEDGNTAYWSCDKCNKYFSEGTKDTTKEIAENSWVIAAHHTMNPEAVSAKAAICLSTGNLAYYTCSACDVKFKDADGKEAYARDGEVLAIDASNHASEATSWVSTDGAEHWKTYDCCNAEVEGTRADHAYSWTSDGNNGYDGVCECGATAHSDGAPEHVCVFDGPWLSANGKHFHECTVYPECHEKQGEADHNFGAYVTVSDTLRVSTCADCGATRTVTSRPSTDPGTPITPTEPGTGDTTEDEGLTDIEDETTPLAGLPFDLAPTDELTRGLFAEILYWYEGEPEPDGEAPFTDVEGHEYAQAITWGAVNGVLLGYDDDTYRPDNAITRGEMESILKRYVQYKQSKVVVALSGDKADVMLWMEAEEIIDNFFAALAIEAE